VRAQRLEPSLAGARHAHQPVVEARRVRQEVTRGDRLAERLLDAKRAKGAVHVGVGVERARLDELHRGGRREELRDGCDTEQCALWVDRRPRREVGRAEALRQRHPIAAHQHEDRPRHVPLAELRREEAGDEPVEVAVVVERGRGVAGRRQERGEGDGERPSARREPHRAVA
jgi:hypothetical protein